MRNLMSRIRHQELGLLAGVAITVLAFGVIVARDLRQSADDASHLHDRLSSGLNLINDLQFQMQEVRRILLYALHTSDANRQLDYAEQSRAADARVRALLNDRARLGDQPPVLQVVATVDSAWMRYLVVRDEVIGLILEGSYGEGVALDEQEGLARFNDVRQAIGGLKASFASDAEAQVLAAKARARASVIRVIILVSSALLGAAVGLYLVNRRAALESRLHSEAHKGSILQAVPDPIISTDAAGRIMEVNDAAERVFGFSRHDALGLHLETVVLPPSRRGELAAVLARPFVSRRTVARFETYGVRAGGTEFPVEIAAVSHTADNARIWTIHISDLTARYRSEQELRAAKEVAEVSARAESDFLTTMSHELRTPLTGVIGIADLLQNSPSPASQRDLVHMLRSSATALLGLVSDVLDYSRIERGLMDLSPVDFRIRDCIEDAIDPVAQAAARKGLEIGYLIDESATAAVRADEDRVRQVLLNLLSNAVKFTEAGEVVVQASARQLAKGSRAISISVRDTGPGIPEHLHAKLFQRFSQITRQHGGTGLGLAISKRLSELLGGSLNVTSLEGKGTTFQFDFRAAPAPGTSPDAFQGSLPGTRVLLATGPGIIGQQVRALLASWGVEVAGVLGPHSPATKPPHGIDAVIVDADGEQCCALARQCLSAWSMERVPCVVVARPRAEVDAGTAHDYRVRKPISASRLHEALVSAIHDIRGGAMPVRPPTGITPFPAASLAILLAEDNEPNRRVMQLMLNELGLTADEVAGGGEAVERALAHPYDVILMDVQMPGLDGLEAARRIRAQSSGKRPLIIALTANVTLGEEARCLRAGMDRYLSKPIRLETLASIFRPLVATTTRT